MAEKVNTTKKNILEGAISLFREKGYDKVTVKDICASANISKHTFYYYFNSKDDLLAAFKTIPEEVRIEMLQSILDADNYFEQYWAIMETMIDFIVSVGPEILKRILILNVRHDINTFDIEERKKTRELEKAVVLKSQEAGEIRNQSPPGELIHVAFRLITAAAFTWIKLGDIDLKSEARACVEVAFDVRPDLRKGKLQHPKSRENCAGCVETKN